MNKALFIRLVALLLALLCVLTTVSCGTPQGSETEEEPEETEAMQTEKDPAAAFAGCRFLELYVFPMAENSFRCTILPGTLREKTWSELLDKTMDSVSIPEAKQILAELALPDDAITIHPYASSLSSYRFVADDAYLARLCALFDGRYRCAEPRHTQITGADMPDDFEFFLRFGVYGIHSYDSKTQTLIKTTETEHPEKYTRKLVLDYHQRSVIYSLLTQSIDLFSYPETYDPFNDPESDIHMISSPCEVLVITVTAGGRTVTVTCPELVLSMNDEGYCDDATKFLEALSAVQDVITSTEEWKSFPELEFFYL